MSSNNNKPPLEQLKEAIKSAVSSTNESLEKLQSRVDEWKKPIFSTLQTVEQNGAMVMSTISNIYQRRHEYAPEIICGTTLMTGGYFWLRRSRLAGILGGSIGAGAAYALVYDEFQLDKVPDVLFGGKK
jgi:methanogenic corrinoid protein MtbC1